MSDVLLVDNFHDHAHPEHPSAAFATGMAEVRPSPSTFSSRPFIFYGTALGTVWRQYTVQHDII